MLSAQFKSFIERDAQHGVVGLELLNVDAENFFLLLREPSAPISIDGCSADEWGADGVFHGRSPGEQSGEYIKKWAGPIKMIPKTGTEVSQT